METTQWAIKYRPTKFSEVYGCSTIKAMVESDVKNDKWPKSVLLMGQYGSGKTTCAKLLAMTMMCQHKDAEGNPCGECPDCKAILEERYTRDVKRVCAEDIRQEGGYTEGIANFLSQAKTQPFFGKRKIIIFEEIQTILNAGNAKGAIDLLLKEIENPNSKTYWIFTSMDTIIVPTKGGTKAGPGGFLSRQVIHKFYPAADSDILKYLYNLAHRIEYERDDFKGSLWDWMLKNTSKEFCTNGLLEMAKGSEGSYRQATQMLQTCIESNIFDISEIRKQFGLLEDAIVNKVLYDIANNVKTEKVIQMLGDIDGTNYVRLYYSWARALKEAEMARIFGKVIYKTKDKESGKTETHIASADSEGRDLMCYNESLGLANGVNFAKLKAIFAGFSDAEKGFNADLFIMRLLDCYS